MDNYGTQVQVVSISEPGVYFMPTSQDRVALAQQVNNYMYSELINASDPALAGRFGAFAVLPLGPKPSTHLDAHFCQISTRLGAEPALPFSSRDEGKAYCSSSSSESPG
jgi:hypothetical protein